MAQPARRSQLSRNIPRGWIARIAYNHQVVSFPPFRLDVVDEAQFLPPAVIEDLRRITVDPGVPVICYGLRTDFRTRLFPAAQRLMELADRIEEVKVTCQYCAKKAICNLRFVNGTPTVRGPQIQLGADEHYAPVCWNHYDEATRALVQDTSGAVLRPS